MTKAERYKAMLIKIRHKNGNAADLEAFVDSEQGRQPETEDAKALVLYFGGDADREEFIAMWNETHPNTVTRKVL